MVRYRYNADNLIDSAATLFSSTCQSTRMTQDIRSSVINGGIGSEPAREACYCGRRDSHNMLPSVLPRWILNIDLTRLGR